MIKVLAGTIITGAVIGFILWSYATGTARPLTGNPYGCSSCATYCTPLTGTAAGK